MTPEILEHHGRQISAIRSGKGPLVVLLPPGASSASAWRKVSEVLSPRWECLAVNPSGYGETEAFSSDRPMTLADEAAAVQALLADHRDPVHLVGHSYGGAMAIQLALTDASRFSSLTLIEPAAYPLLSQAGEKVLSDEIEAINRSFIDRVHAGNEATAFEDYFNFYNGTPGAWSRLPDAVRERLLTVAKPVAAALTAVHAWDCDLNLLRSLSIPTLVVSGAQTDRAHAVLTEVVAKCIPGARLEIIPDAGHMSSLTHPHEFAELVQAHTAASGRNSVIDRNH